jgi:general secretion pathway protein G
MRRVLVIATLALLLPMAGAGYKTLQQKQRLEKERALRQTLFVFRSAIDQFTMEKEEPPRNLLEMVTAGYVWEIPLDPMTGRNDTWKTTQDIMGEKLGITDIRSGSEQIGTDGRPYSSW